MYQLFFLIALALIATAIAAWLMYQKEIRKTVAVETQVAATETATEQTTDALKKIKVALHQLSVIRDAPMTWIIESLRTDSEAEIVTPNQVAISLRGAGKPNYMLLIPKFLQEMQMAGFELLDDGRMETHVTKLLFLFEKDAERIVIELTENTVKPALVFALPEMVGVLEDWLESEGPNEGEYAVASAIVTHTSQNCDSECRTAIFNDVRLAIARCRVEIRYPVPDNSFTIYRASMTAGGDWVPRQARLQASLTPEKIFSLSYGKATMAGKEHSLAELLPKLVELMKVSRFNGTVSGLQGRGKTQLARYLATLAHTAGIKTLLTEDSSKILPTIEMMRDTTEPWLWVLEDIQRLSLEELSALANLMQGASTPPKLSILAMYNQEEAAARPEILKMIQETLERPSRTNVIIKLVKLDAAQSVALKDAIEGLMPDQVLVKPWVPGEYSLAEIWANFVPKIVKELL